MHLNEILDKHSHYNEIIPASFLLGKFSIVNSNDAIWLDLTKKARVGQCCMQEINNIKMKLNVDMLIGPYGDIRHSLYPGHTHHNQYVHLGIDMLLPTGTPVFSPLSGKVIKIEKNLGKGDYGNFLLLEHYLNKTYFYTLFAHLANNITVEFQQPIKSGQQIGYIGNEIENGGWVPHLHFQILSELLVKQNILWGAVIASKSESFLQQCPDPGIILGVRSWNQLTV